MHIMILLAKIFLLFNIHNKKPPLHMKAILTPHVKNKRKTNSKVNLRKIVSEVRHFHQKTNLRFMSFREHIFL